MKKIFFILFITYSNILLSQESLEIKLIIRPSAVDINKNMYALHLFKKDSLIFMNYKIDKLNSEIEKNIPTDTTFSVSYNDYNEIVKLIEAMNFSELLVSEDASIYIFNDPYSSYLELYNSKCLFNMGVVCQYSYVKKRKLEKYNKLCNKLLLIAGFETNKY